eukprot:62181-Pyramimonas_sp.AAC.1
MPFGNKATGDFTNDSDRAHYAETQLHLRNWNFPLVINDAPHDIRDFMPYFTRQSQPIGVTCPRADIV